MVRAYGHHAAAASATAADDDGGGVMVMVMMMVMVLAAVNPPFACRRSTQSIAHTAACWRSTRTGARR